MAQSILVLDEASRIKKWWSTYKSPCEETRRESYGELDCGVARGFIWKIQHPCAGATAELGHVLPTLINISS